MTLKKSGEEAARHIEILASGTVPFFIDLDSVSNNSLAFHRKDLLRAAQKLHGVRFGYLDASVFNVSSYVSLAQDLLLWTRHRLTTAAIARYVLQVLGVPPAAYHNTSILYLQPNHVQMFSFYLLHGFREILTPSNV